MTGSSKSTSGCPQEEPCPDRLPAHVPDFFASQIEHKRPRLFSVDNPTRAHSGSCQEDVLANPFAELTRVQGTL